MLLGCQEIHVRAIYLKNEWLNVGFKMNWLHFSLDFNISKFVRRRFCLRPLSCHRISLLWFELCLCSVFKSERYSFPSWCLFLVSASDPCLFYDHSLIYYSACVLNQLWSLTIIPWLPAINIMPSCCICILPHLTVLQYTIDLWIWLE